MNQSTRKLHLILILFFSFAAVAYGYRLIDPIYGGRNGKAPSDGPPFLKFGSTNQNYHIAASKYNNHLSAVCSTFASWNSAGSVIFSSSPSSGLPLETFWDDDGKLKYPYIVNPGRAYPADDNYVINTNSSYVKLNTYHTWGTIQRLQEDKFDVETILVHEVGHIHGLAHPYPGDYPHNGSAPIMAGGDNEYFWNHIARSLRSDDINGTGFLQYNAWVPVQFPTIENAINNSFSGGTVHVAAGTYNETITMKSGVGVDGAGKYSTTINGTLTWQNKSNAKLKDLTFNERITINSGSYNKVENVQAKKRIVLNYGSDHEIRDVTANHTDGYGIYALDTDPYIDNFIYNTRYPVGIYGLSGAYLDIHDGQLEDKSRGVMLYGYSDAVLSYMEFCLNGFDIYAYTGSSANAYSCVWSGNPQYKTYGDVDWVPVSYDYCGMYKSVVAQQQPASAVHLASLENEPGWDKYIQALSDYNALKELLRSDTLSGRENVPEKYVSEYESVIDLFKQIVTEYPGSLVSIKAISRIADCYWNLRQPEMVFDYINVLLDNPIYDSLRPYAFKELVPYYLSKNDNEQALKVIDEVLALSIDDQLTGETLFSKGIVYKYYEDDRTRAADVFQEVIALYPDSPLILIAQAELEDMGVEYEAGDSTSTVAADGQLVIQTYPNPFNPTATIRFGLPDAGKVQLVVYDLMGREVARLVDHYLEAGWRDVAWEGLTTNGREVPTGVYIARLVTPQGTKAIKLVLMK